MSNQGIFGFPMGGIAPFISARVYSTAVQSIPNTTDTALTFNAKRFDTDNIHDLVTNVSRLTCRTAGKYLIGGSVSMDTVAASYANNTFIRLNGSTNIDAHERTKDASSRTFNKMFTLYHLEGGDYIEFIVWQNSGAARNTIVALQTSPEVWMMRVGL